MCDFWLFLKKIDMGNPVEKVWFLTNFQKSPQSNPIQNMTFGIPFFYPLPIDIPFLPFMFAKRKKSFFFKICTWGFEKKLDAKIVKEFFMKVVTEFFPSQVSVLRDISDRNQKIPYENVYWIFFLKEFLIKEVTEFFSFKEFLMKEIRNHLMHEWKKKSKPWKVKTKFVIDNIITRLISIKNIAFFLKCEFI